MFGSSNTDEYYMRLALREAEKAYERQEVPIGAVIVHENKVIGKGYNQIEMLQDPTAHAEMIAITAAVSSLGSRRLLDCTLYVTIEPCCMCAGAIVLARIPRLVFGAADPKAGACTSLYSITEDSRLNHRCTVEHGLLQEDSAGIIRAFFAERRKAKSNGGVSGAGLV